MLKIVQNQGLVFLLLPFAVLFPPVSDAQTISKWLVNTSLKGLVVDSETDEPINGVTIRLEATKQTVQTDQSGHFLLETAAKFPITLTLSSLSYETKTFVVESFPIVIQLTPSSAYVDEVVIVGYGKQKKISVTNAISQLNGEDIARRPVGSIAQSLQGMAPGVTIQDLGGRPGANNVAIRFRGVTTLGNNSPLTIVDGVEQSIANLNPNDIETISLLKDASAAAIYGSRAANGVILVTTKQGKEGNIQLNYDGYYALQDVANRPQHMGLEEYFRLENIAYINAGQPAPYSNEYILNYVANAPSPAYPLPYSFWERGPLGMLKIAPKQHHSVAVSGGNEMLKARLAVRIQRTDGIISNVNDEQNEVRLNMGAQVSSRLRVSADINARLSEAVQPADGVDNVFQYMLHASKFSWPQYETGEYGLGPQANNPLLFAELTGLDIVQNTYVLANLKADFEIAKNLMFSTQYAIRYNGLNGKNFRDSYSNTDPITGRTTQRLINSLTETRGSLQENTLNSLLTYSVQKEKHGIEALLGYSTVRNQQDNLVGFRQNFYNNDVQSLSQGSDENRNATGVDSEYALRSFFGRINYSYNDKYFGEANLRYDGSSRFSRDNRYSLFPSFSLGWRLSEEAFWENIKPFVNELKLRGSWGATGNQSVDLYSYYQTLSAINYSFDGAAAQGLAQTNFSNDQLTWETVIQTNIGLDAHFLNRALTMTFDLYTKTTKDILLQLPIPSLIGLNAPFQNAGVVRNNGFELGFNYRKSTKLNYDIGAHVAYNRNKVMNLANTGPYISGSTTGPRFIIQEGLPIYGHWGYLTDGVFQTKQEVDAYPTLYANSAPGDVKYLDLDGNGIINSDDQTYLGSSFPVFDFGGHLALGYKRVGIHIQWQGAAGHKTRLDGAFQQIATFETFTHNIYTNNYWTPENPDARFPRPIKGNDRNFQTSDVQLLNASYFRIKNIEVNYSLPTNNLKYLGVKGARVYASASNVLTFSELNEWNLDPEIPSGRAQYYPQVKSYTLGMNLSF